jgi:pheromone shutdown protein TraB
MSASSPAGRSPRALVTTLILGAASAGLYLLLFLFSDRLTELAAATRAGHAIYALVPLVVAMVFSLVHGAFTGQFWDLLGLRAKK